METIGLLILVVLGLLFEKKNKTSNKKQDEALSGLYGECKKLSERGLLRKRA